MLDDDFRHILSKEYLIQPYKEFPHIVDNTFYEVSLNHMFNEYKSFDKQLNDVSNYCKKRIERFKAALREGKTLLVYYSRDEKECLWIASNSELLKSYCQKYGFDWLFITNYPLPDCFSFPNFMMPINNIHKPYGGGVSFPFENEEMIVKFLANHYSEEKRKQNLKHKTKRSLLRKVRLFFEKKNGVKLKIN